jgi:hypothetical protein
MPPRQCPYCQSFFTPSRFHPDQTICSAEPCQRRRRTEYHRQKVHADPAYQLIVADSRKKWREAHPDYMRKYRARRRQATPQPTPVDGASLFDYLARRVKNNVAFNLSHCAAAVWLVCQDNDGVKNTIARAQVILIECLPEPAEQCSA